MYCLICGKEKSAGSFKDILIGEDPLCDECRSKWKRINHHFRIDNIPVFAPYLYEEEFSHCLIQFKECGDEALKDIFLFDIKNEFKRKYRGYTLCLMPSSVSKEEIRGFSHLKKMFECLNMDMLSPFKKMDEISQKHLHSSERMELVHGIQRKDNVILPKKILLCDDTITTGSTLRGALSCLDKSMHDIQIFSISVNKSWTKKDELSLSIFRNWFFKSESKHHKKQRS